MLTGHCTFKGASFGKSTLNAVCFSEGIYNCFVALLSHKLDPQLRIWVMPLRLRDKGIIDKVTKVGKIHHSSHELQSFVKLFDYTTVPNMEKYGTVLFWSHTTSAADVHVCTYYGFLQIWHSFKDKGLPLLLICSHALSIMVHFLLPIYSLTPSMAL